MYLNVIEMKPCVSSCRTQEPPDSLPTESLLPISLTPIAPVWLLPHTPLFNAANSAVADKLAATTQASTFFCLDLPQSTQSFLQCTPCFCMARCLGQLRQHIKSRDISTKQNCIFVCFSKWLNLWRVFLTKVPTCVCAQGSSYKLLHPNIFSLTPSSSSPQTHTHAWRNAGLGDLQMMRKLAEKLELSELILKIDPHTYTQEDSITAFSVPLSMQSIWGCICC